MNEEMLYQAVIDTLLDYDPEKDYYGSNAHFSGAKEYYGLMDVLEMPHGGESPNRDEFMAAIAQMITPEQAEIFPVFPDFSFDPEYPPAQPLSWIAKRIRPELAGRIQELTEGMVKKHFIVCMGERDGEKVYMRNYLFGLVSAYLFTRDTPLSEPALNWYYNVIKGDGVSAKIKISPVGEETLPHEGALTGNPKFGKISMNMPIPDEREVIPYDRASQVIENARSLAVKPCLCRSTMERKGKKECDIPVEGYCMMFDEAADRIIASGIGTEKTKEEMLELLREARDMGLVQQVGNANRTITMCNCCKDCCIFLQTLARGERTLTRPSRFVAKRMDECKQCGACMNVCPMECIKMTVTGAMVLSDKCIGCGLCATRCQFGALGLEKRDPEIIKERDRKVLNRVFG